MNILKEIIENKSAEVQIAKEKHSLDSLKNTDFFNRKTISLAKRLVEGDGTQIISEFKRKSPSKGEINIGAGIAETSKSYSEFGAAGISILTDTMYFGGFEQDLKIARSTVGNTPLLRKDFMVDPYQIYEAKAWGADVILLIAANLTPKMVTELSTLAKNLDLEVLLEVHDLAEVKSSNFDTIDIVGVNNRNLKNFAENNVNASLELFEYLPKNVAKISESCIHSHETVKLLQSVGYNGFLIGESFMKTDNPGKAFSEFLNACNEV
ncbi:MAG: indole-3-glycerol phosphate synthase TrpC [Leadbetterella sp.]